MIRRRLLMVLALLAAPHAAVAQNKGQDKGQNKGQDKGQVNVICSVQADWCGMIQTVFTRSTGIRVNLSMRGSGEALGQLHAWAQQHAAQSRYRTVGIYSGPLGFGYKTELIARWEREVGALSR